MNLLNNAIRYTPEMGVIVVSIKNSLKTSNEYYKITVRDNGNGIPAEKFEIIK